MKRAPKPKKKNDALSPKRRKSAPALPAAKKRSSKPKEPLFELEIKKPEKKIPTNSKKKTPSSSSSSANAVWPPVDPDPPARKTRRKKKEPIHEERISELDELYADGDLPPPIENDGLPSNIIDFMRNEIEDDSTPEIEDDMHNGIEDDSILKNAHLETIKLEEGDSKFFNSLQLDITQATQSTAVPQGLQTQDSTTLSLPLSPAPSTSCPFPCSFQDVIDEGNETRPLGEHDGVKALPAWRTWMQNVANVESILAKKSTKTNQV